MSVPNDDGGQYSTMGTLTGERLLLGMAVVGWRRGGRLKTGEGALPRCAEVKDGLPCDGSWAFTTCAIDCGAAEGSVVACVIGTCCEGGRVGRERGREGGVGRLRSHKMLCQAPSRLHHASPMPNALYNSSAMHRFKASKVLAPPAPSSHSPNGPPTHAVLPSFSMPSFSTLPHTHTPSPQYTGRNAGGAAVPRRPGAPTTGSRSSPLLLLARSHVYCLCFHPSASPALHN